MKKRKDGKIVASLTEVKNKTGDIFSLVDEFGEVLLTSYNKTKYRILKVDITEVLNLKIEKQDDEVAEEATKQPENKTLVEKVKEVFAGHSKPEQSPAFIEPMMKEETRQSFKNMNAWNPNSKTEYEFRAQIVTPLQ
jgi:phosphoribosylformylglycinamidine (FGAM) synthase PurS component